MPEDEPFHPHDGEHVVTKVIRLPVDSWAIFRRDAMHGLHTDLVFSDGLANDESLGCWHGDEESRGNWGIGLDEAMALIWHIAWHAFTLSPPDPECNHRQVSDEFD